MSEPAQAGKTCDLRGIREAVCVHTGKITDSCLAKDGYYKKLNDMQSLG